jgi:hypothetical protein
MRKKTEKRVTWHKPFAGEWPGPSLRDARLSALQIYKSILELVSFGTIICM